MIVAIPSKGRPGKVSSLKYIPSANLFVPEYEADSYRRAGHECVGVPCDVRGITATRNWILNHVKDHRVVFIDDDAKKVGWTKMYRHKCRHKALSEVDLLGEFSKLFDVTESMNYRIWGCHTQAAPRSIYPYWPFRFRTYVTASCMGMINTPDLRFDESVPRERRL